MLGVIEELTGRGLTMLIVTHQMEFASHVADEVLFLDLGRIVERAAAATFFTAPRSERAQRFLRRLRLGPSE